MFEDIDRTYQIRALTPEDARLYAPLRRTMLIESPLAFSAAPGSDPSSDEAVVRERLALPERAIIGGFHVTELVAAAGLVRDLRPKMAHLCTVWGVWVAPAHRRRGLGEAVMGGVIAMARSWPGVRALCLSAGAGQGAAVRLYQRLGFVPWGLEPGVLMHDGKYHDELHMQLRL